MICTACKENRHQDCPELKIDVAKLAEGLPDYATAHFCPCQHKNSKEVLNGQSLEPASASG